MFPLPHFPPLQNRADFSTPAFIFYPCKIVPMFPLLHFPPLQNRADISTPVFSTPAF